MDNESLSEFLEQYEFDAASPEDIFKVLETLETGGGVTGSSSSSSSVLHFNNPPVVGPTDHHEPAAAAGFLNLKEGGGGGGGGMELQAMGDYSEKKELVMIMNETNPVAPLPKSKRQKLSSSSSSSFAINNNNNNNNGGGGGGCLEEGAAAGNGQQKMAHITVERNRRKQMNEHLAILRSLMPCFYVKRGDQASVIGGVVNYINELQQVLQSLEAKKQRKVFSEVLSPRIISPSPLSPRKPPLSPRLLTTLPVSPRTPPSTTTTTTTSCSPYKPRLPAALYPPPSPPSSSATNSSADSVNELVANSKSVVADVEVKFSGANVLVQTVSRRIHGQAVKIIGALENLNLEILQVNITTFEETMICSFTIKIGIECELSADDLAHLVQQTFC